MNANKRWTFENAHGVNANNPKQFNSGLLAKTRSHNKRERLTVFSG
jgi:hypothetical protein